MNATLEKISVRQALLAASGQTVRHGDKRWKIEAREHGIYFSCTAQDLDPHDAEEERFCIMDLWRSETARASSLLAKAIELGCAREGATI
jgi:hypothetical protein